MKKMLYFLSPPPSHNCTARTTNILTQLSQCIYYLAKSWNSQNLREYLSLSPPSLNYVTTTTTTWLSQYIIATTPALNMLHTAQYKTSIISTITLAQAHSTDKLSHTSRNYTYTRTNVTQTSQNSWQMPSYYNKGHATPFSAKWITPI